MREFSGYMKGINLGGWLSQRDNSTKEFRDSFITIDDIRTLKKWGLDHVRLPVDHDILRTEDGYSHIDDCIGWCREEGLKMILDLHKADGYSFCPLDKDDKRIFFHDKGMQEKFYSIWDEISSRYAKDSDIVAFELLNEIVYADVKDEWNDIASKTIEVIRKNAPDSWIVFGGVLYNSVSAVPWLCDVSDRKVVYTFHCYEPMIFTHQGAYWVENMPEDFRITYPADLDDYRKASKELSQELAGVIYDKRLKNGFDPDYFALIFEEAVKVCEERDIPLYCGEYGVIELADRKDTVRWLRDINTAFRRFNIGRAYWNYKEMDFGIAGESTADIIDDIVSYL